MTIQSIQSTKRGPMRPPVLNTTIIETTLCVGSNVTITLFGLNCLHLGDIVPHTGFYCLDGGAAPLLHSASKVPPFSNSFLVHLRVLCVFVVTFQMVSKTDGRW